MKLILFLILLIACFALGMDIVSHPLWLRSHGKSEYCLAKETLKDGVDIFTLEVWRHGPFKSFGRYLTLCRTFDEAEAQKWAQMFGIEIEDISAQ